MSSGYRMVDLADLAAGQWGLFTTAQAKALGFSTQQIARLAARGMVERLRHGVYRISGAPSVPDEQLRASWLAIEPAIMAGERLGAEQPAVVSHRSAARVHGLGDVDADVMEFTTAGRKQSRLADVRYRQAVLDRSRWTLVDGLPVTTALATIEDLAADQLDGGHLAGVVRDAVTTGKADTDAVIAVLRPYAHTYGAPLGDGAWLLDRFLTEAGVPESTRALSRHLMAGSAPTIADTYRALAGNPALQLEGSDAANSLLQATFAQWDSAAAGNAIHALVTKAFPPGKLHEALLASLQVGAIEKTLRAAGTGAAAPAAPRADDRR
ncbi:hypothetical protein M2284_005280 [Rhodococcus sp. LBL1]|nr:hypothetical protein [Rhodococcus sp. LBL1]MDH6686343.1 hypothetical protein [Rhodococcus sp. LBL2]